MPDEIPRLVVWFIPEDCIESLALYDREEFECGVAELIEREPQKERWRLECRVNDNVITAYAVSLSQALAWLIEKRNQYFQGGCVRAVADFQVDESGERKGDV